MKCVICRQAETIAGTTTATFERDGMTVVVKSIPAQVCPNCDEVYVSDEITARLLKDAERAIENAAEVEVRHFLAM
jgi:YgiT-type zinc finger domain-containing protein